MKKTDELKEQIFTLLNKGVQFDFDIMMLHLIANKNVLAKDKIEHIRARLDVIEVLLKELEHETKD